MAGEATTIEEVLAAVALPGAGGGSGLVEQLDRLTSQMQRLQSASLAAVESTQSNTRAIEAVPAIANALGGSSLGSALLGSLTFGLSPLISGLARLFGGGGGDTTELPPLVRFTLPPPVDVNAGISQAVPGSPFLVDQGQGGLPRPVTTPAPSQVTVQIQALDSQSFLDRSGDIAAAVRQAMLESGVLSDVIREA